LFFKGPQWPFFFPQHGLGRKPRAQNSQGAQRERSLLFPREPRAKAAEGCPPGQFSKNRKKCLAGRRYAARRGKANKPPKKLGAKAKRTLGPRAGTETFKSIIKNGQKKFQKNEARRLGTQGKRAVGFVSSAATFGPQTPPPPTWGTGGGGWEPKKA